MSTPVFNSNVAPIGGGSIRAFTPGVSNWPVDTGGNKTPRTVMVIVGTAGNLNCTDGTGVSNIVPLQAGWTPLWINGIASASTTAAQIFLVF